MARSHGRGTSAQIAPWVEAWERQRSAHVPSPEWDHAQLVIDSAAKARKDREGADARLRPPHPSDPEAHLWD